MNPGIIQDVRPGVDDSFVIIIGVQNHPYVPIPIIYFSSNWIQIRCMLQFFWQKYKSIRYGETRQRKLRKITKISSIPTYLSAKSAQKIRIWVLRLSCYAWKILLNYSNTESKVVYPLSSTRLFGHEWHHNQLDVDKYFDNALDFQVQKFTRNNSDTKMHLFARHDKVFLRRFLNSSTYTNNMTATKD